MRYQKIISLLDNKPKQPSNFRIKNWVEINYDARGTNNKNNQIKFKTSMLMPSLCDYIDVYILVSGTITIIGVGDNDNARRLEERNKKETYKNCVPFTDCISIRNNTQIDNAKELDVVMPMYNLIEYSENYSKTSGLFSTLQRWSKW